MFSDKHVQRHDRLYRADGAPAPTDDQGMTGNKQWEHFIRALAELSGSAGNARLRTTLGWDEGAYDEVKGQLIDAGLVVAGRGRGGSVALSEGINEQLANGEATPEPAPPRSKAATKGARTAKQPKQATARNSGNSGNGGDRPSCSRPPTSCAATWSRPTTSTSRWV